MGKQPNADRIRAAANAANARDGSPPLKRPTSSGVSTKTPAGKPPGGGGAKPPATGSRLPVPAGGRAMKPSVLEGEVIPKKNVPAKTTPRVGSTIVQSKPSLLGRAAGVAGRLARGAGTAGLGLMALQGGYAAGSAISKFAEKNAAMKRAQRTRNEAIAEAKANGTYESLRNPKPKPKTNTPLPTKPAAPKPKATAPKPKPAAPKPKTAAPKPGFSPEIKKFAASERAALQNDPRAKKKDPVTFKPRSSGVKLGPSVFQS